MHTQLYLENLKGRPLVTPRHIWEDNIKIDLKGIRYKHVDCIQLIQGSVQ